MSRAGDANAGRNDGGVTSQRFAAFYRARAIHSFLLQVYAGGAADDPSIGGV